MFDFEQVNIFWVGCLTKEIFNIEIFQSFSNHASKQIFPIPYWKCNRRLHEKFMQVIKVVTRGCYNKTPVSESFFNKAAGWRS